MRPRLVIRTIALIASLATFLGGTVRAQEPAHDAVRASLVHLSVSGTPQSGPNTGVDGGVLSQGTGFVVSSDGFILTTRHLFAPLEKVDAVNVIVVGRFADAGATAMPVQFVSDLPRLDLALLRADVPFGTAPPPALEIGSTATVDRGAPPSILTSGFSGDNYRRRVAEYNDAESAHVPYAWTLNVKTNDGQSGSPVYTERDGEVQVIGVVKATAREDDELTLMIPIEYSMPLIGHLRFQALSDRLDRLTRLIGDMTEGDPPLFPRIEKIEGDVEEIGSHFTWHAESASNGSIIIRYEKIISGGPHVDRIRVNMTPYMRFHDEEGDGNGEGVVFTTAATDLRLPGGGRFEREMAGPESGVGEFVIPGVATLLKTLVDLTARAVGGAEPYRDVEISLVPFVGDQALLPRKLFVVPDFEWADFNQN